MTSTRKAPPKKVAAKVTGASAISRAPKSHPIWNFFKLSLATLAAALIGAACLALFIFAFVYQQLPPIDTVIDYRPKVPMRVWTADGKLIAEFGEERRDFVHINEIPDHVKNAVISAEDATFYDHIGIEPKGFIRAAIANFKTGRTSQGASTITMQVARNFFLSSERSYIRKLYEVAMAFKIESNLTKDEILEIYMNQIFLGNRAYGFAAAGRTYYGKNIQDLTIGEAATLAGLPAAPSSYNPFANPERAKVRRDYVLKRMRDLGHINNEQYQHEVASPIKTKLTVLAESALTPTKMNSSLHAEYVAELVRTLMYDIFQQETYTRGLNVYTTINSTDQNYAYQSLRSNVQKYDRGQGYRGPEANIDISDPKTRKDNIKNALQEALYASDMPACVVLAASPTEVEVELAQGKTVKITGKGLDFVKKSLQPKASSNIRIQPGSVVRIQGMADGQWEITQIPQAEAAFIAVKYATGAVQALVGGYDFNLNKFNHVTQAWRQPGSSFKPFIYSAAIEKGFSPQTVINDAPIVLDPAETGFKRWNPKNFSHTFQGPIMMKDALKKSLNLVSVRIVQAITPRYAVNFIQRFGFEADRHPAYLSLGLGAGSVTPWEMVRGFSVFANLGKRVEPYIISKVTDQAGKILMQSTAEVEAVVEGVQALDVRNAYIMHTMLNGVATGGTAARVGATLKRRDIAGKTGTSNDSNDVWFVGYAGTQAAAVWMGYDQLRSLGKRAQGASLALPIWLDYMKIAIKDDPIIERKAPHGVTEDHGAIYYTNRKDAIPSLGLDQPKEDDPIGEVIKNTNIREQIF
ncbi:MAG: PBP1A family penicillin-binding protein [Burkholderiales bacterium]|nr:PBP1A family penicillin-binding protein [Burkholderiales bacterium]